MLLPRRPGSLQRPLCCPSSPGPVCTAPAPRGCASNQGGMNDVHQTSLCFMSRLCRAIRRKSIQWTGPGRPGVRRRGNRAQTGCRAPPGSLGENDHGLLSELRATVPSHPDGVAPELSTVPRPRERPCPRPRQTRGVAVRPRGPRSWPRSAAVTCHPRLVLLHF